MTTASKQGGQRVKELQLHIPAPSDQRGKPLWINANDRYGHWAAKSRKIKTWRSLAYWLARQHDLPAGLEYVHIVAYVHKTNKRAYDAHNLYPTCKATIDGLVDHGLIVDDTNAHLQGPDMRPGEIHEKPGITLTISY